MGPAARAWTVVVATLLVAISGESISVNRVYAQAWTRPAGHAYVKLTRAYAEADERFDLTGRRVPYSSSDPNAAFRDDSYYLYAEYGVTGHLTLVGLVPYKQIEVRGSDDDRTAARPGSVELGIRYALQEHLGLTNDRHRVAISGNVTLPTGYVRNAVPSVGSGETAVDFRLAYGASAYPLPAYAQIATGYRIRTSMHALSRTVDCPDAAATTCIPGTLPELDNEWLLRGEAGVTLGTYVLLQMIVQGQWSNSPPESEFNPDNPVATRQRFMQAGVGVGVYPVPWLGISVQVFDKRSGKNTIDATDWFFGIELITDRR